MYSQGISSNNYCISLTFQITINPPGGVCQSDTNSQHGCERTNGRLVIRRICNSQWLVNLRLIYKEYDSLYKCNAMERCLSKSWKNPIYGLHIQLQVFRGDVHNSCCQNYMIVEQCQYCVCCPKYNLWQYD